MFFFLIIYYIRKSYISFSTENGDHLTVADLTSSSKFLTLAVKDKIWFDYILNDFQRNCSH